MSFGQKILDSADSRRTHVDQLIAAHMQCCTMNMASQAKPIDLIRNAALHMDRNYEKGHLKKHRRQSSTAQRCASFLNFLSLAKINVV